MSNDTKYYQDLLDELDYIQSNPRGVRLTTVAQLPAWKVSILRDLASIQKPLASFVKNLAAQEVIWTKRVEAGYPGGHRQAAHEWRGWEEYFEKAAKGLEGLKESVEEKLTDIEMLDSGWFDNKADIWSTLLGMTARQFGVVANQFPKINSYAIKSLFTDRYAALRRITRVVQEMEEFRKQLTGEETREEPTKSPTLPEQKLQQKQPPEQKKDQFSDQNLGLRPNRQDPKKVPPKPKAAPRKAPGKQPKKTPLSHTVKPGDTLSGIAKHYLGNGNLWKQIHQLNPQIKNPNLIYPGQKIKLPQGK